MKNPFSVRHKKIIESESWLVAFSKAERTRLVSFLYGYNGVYDHVTETNFHFTNSVFEMVYSDLKEIYGYSVLKSYVEGQFVDVQELDKFIKGTKPPYILDSVELIYGYIIDNESKF